jgi:flagellar hook-basal body complex protein FliE
MPAPISSIVAHLPAAGVHAPAAVSKPGEFKNVLETAIQHVEQFRNDANVKVEKFLSGETEELHSAALAVQKADLAFDLGLQVRNKVVEAYQEIMRMQM